MCVCVRCLVTSSCVIRETTQTCPRSRPRVSLSVYLPHSAAGPESRVTLRTDETSQADFEVMPFAPRTRLFFLVILLQWPLHLLGVHACEQCEIDAAESQADGAVAGCVDTWDECDDPETPQVEGCEGDPPEFLCPALVNSGLCDATFGGALPDWHARLRDTPGAAFLEQRVWRHCPRSCGRCARDEARRHRERGLEAEGRGELREAEDALRAAVALQPHDAEHHSALGELLHVSSILFLARISALACGHSPLREPYGFALGL